MSELCHCGSGRTLDDCCGACIAGERLPATAEELMRSRYSAFVLGDVDYILSTHHPRTRDSVKRDEIEHWSGESEWLGFEVESVEGGAAGDSDGVVVFRATYRLDDVVHDHHERSLFEFDDGRWWFVDAEKARQEPIRREEPKVGRNDPCTCGSGLKYKRCHGAAVTAG